MPATAGIVLTLAWGAFAFGGTYWWTSWPLIVACLVCGGLALSWGGDGLPLRVAASLLIVGAALGFQLVPLSAGSVAMLSPEAARLFAALDATYVVRAPHALSILPPMTWQALGLYAAFFVLMAGTARLTCGVGAAGLVKGITGLGLVLALVALGVRAMGPRGLVYGVWAPVMAGDPFGPFINRNHFAGWMLMAAPLALALACGGLVRGLATVRPSWRDRLLWLGSPEASGVVLAGLAASVMGLALVMTLSRSGISAFLLALVLMGALVMTNTPASGRRVVAAVLLVSVLVTIAAWVGVDAIAARFAESEWRDFNGRRDAWLDALAIARRFWLVGSGLNTYGATTFFFQERGRQDHFEQAHNDYLQLLSEGGLLIVLPVLLAIVMFVWSVARRWREDDPRSEGWWLRAGAVTALVAIACQETVEFSLQMPGNAALFAVLCGIAVHRARTPASRARAEAAAA